MIDAKELRIGNWLKLGKEYTQVYQIIWTRNIGYSVNHKDYFEEIYEPIPLTTEILEKCGFEKRDMGYYTKFGRFGKTGRWITYKFLAEEELLETPFLRYDGLVDIYYLHHLQNFYYALTEKELEINL